MGLGQARFEQSINASNGYVNNIVKSIGVEKLRKIQEEYPQLNTEWLLYGEGDMLKEAPSPKVLDEDDMVSLGEYYPEIRREDFVPFYPYLPVTGGNAVQFDSWEDEHTVRYRYAPEYARRDVVCFTVRGESMSPTVPGGAIVYISKQVSSVVDPDKMYLIITRDGQRMIKRLRLDAPEGNNPGFLCISDNKDHIPFHLDEDEVVAKYRVLGVGNYGDL